MKVLCANCQNSLIFKQAAIKKRKGEEAKAHIIFECELCDWECSEEIPVQVIRGAAQALAEFEDIFGAAE